MTLTTADLVDRAHDGAVDEIDPAARPKRRTFTAAEKLAHLDAYDALEKGSEERGAYLRREGLYSSHLSEWRKQRDRGALAGLTIWHFTGICYTLCALAYSGAWS